MNAKWHLSAGLAAAMFLTACESIPPGAERGPNGTMAYEVLIEASEPGARVEVNRENVGNTPVRIKVFGDPDGTFHDFGSPYYVVQAMPLATNQFAQGRIFLTGQMFSGEDRIPERIYFDMNQPPPPPPPTPYAYPYGPPPAYYYGPPPYYRGPGVRLYFGARPHYYHHHRHYR